MATLRSWEAGESRGGSGWGDLRGFPPPVPLPPPVWGHHSSSSSCFSSFSSSSHPLTSRAFVLVTPLHFHPAQNINASIKATCRSVALSPSKQPRPAWCAPLLHFLFYQPARRWAGSRPRHATGQHSASSYRPCPR